MPAFEKNAADEETLSLLIFEVNQACPRYFCPHNIAVALFSLPPDKGLVGHKINAVLTKVKTIEAVHKKHFLRYKFAAVKHGLR